MLTTSSSANSTGPPAYFVMEEDLKPWELYSVSSAEEPETLDTMEVFFARYRATRGKATNFAYTHDACPSRPGFEDRESNRSNHAIGELREHVCQLAQHEWRICYVHLVEGCANCSETRDRPIRTEWEHQLELLPLSELEQAEIRRGSRRCRRSCCRSHSRDRSHSQRQQSRSPERARSRSRSPRQEHLQAGDYVAPTCHQWESGQASGRDNFSRYDDHDREHREGDPRGHDAHRGRQVSPRSSARYPPHQILVEADLVDSGLRDSAFSRGAEKSGTVERLTIDQYRRMRREVDQARDDALKTQQIAETANRRAYAAERFASQAEPGRRAMMSRLRHLETLGSGAISR
ncbi:hypothetical protein L914_00241 [Phytophthora nicotianae]|uniref:Uncharacterized protein n=2 Tax=Phytophthora nicotianae TaxID=4792 RepID=V9G153_PHYNI|nr:hypothetical protein F443_00277 [Phytophthora nicotianae P1569]ETM56852.1 hypothetical protein L914_00241 [Phytophthora nicotianae]